MKATDKLIVKTTINILECLVLPFLSLLVLQWDFATRLLCAIALFFVSCAVLVFLSWSFKWDDQQGGIMRLIQNGRASQNSNSNRGNEQSTILLTNDGNQESVHMGIDTEEQERRKKRVLVFCAVSLLIAGIFFVFLFLNINEAGLDKERMPNSLDVTIGDGDAPVHFSLASAVRGAIGRGETSVGAIYYNTVGSNVRYTLILQIDDGIELGTYTSKGNKDAKIQLILTKGFLFDVEDLNANIYVASKNIEKSSYDLELSYRNNRTWARYQGTFRADLCLIEESGLSEEAPLHLSGGTFDFKITDSLNPE